QSVGESMSKDEIHTTPSPVYGINTQRNPANTQTKTAVVPTKLKPNAVAAARSGNSTVSSSYASAGTFQEQCVSCKTDKDSAFDAKGNIKGETMKTGTLAAIIGGIDEMVNGDAARQTPDSNLELVFLGLGALVLIFIFQKQFAFSAKKTAHAP